MKYALKYTTPAGSKLIDCANVSPPYRGGAVPAPLPSGGPKWRGIFSEGSDHPVIPNRLESFVFRLIVH